MSPPLATLQDTEQDGFTASIATSPSTPPQSVILIAEASLPHHPTIDSDPVPPTSQWRTFKSSNPSATDLSLAPTTGHISDAANEEFTTHLEASFSREVFHSPMSHPLIAIFLAFHISCYHPLTHFNFFLDVSFITYVNFTCSNVL